jgi:hypothetical protein
LAGAAIVAAVALLYRPRLTTALDAAWEILVPHLLSQSPSYGLDELMAGLANISEGRGDLRRRRKCLETAIRYYDARTLQHPRLNSVLTAVCRLALADSIQRKDWDEAMALLDALASRFLLGELPADGLDTVTKNGGRLMRLAPELRVILRWRLYRACEREGLCSQDVLALVNWSRYFAVLLGSEPPATATSVSHALATIACLREAPAVGFQTPAHSQADKAARKFLQGCPEALAWSDDASMWATPQGLTFQGVCHTMPPVLSVEPVHDYLPTDSGVRRRVIGHVLWVNDLKVPFNGWNGMFGDERPDEARQAARRIAALSEFLFEQVRPRARELAEQSSSGRLRLLRRHAAAPQEDAIAETAVD